MCSSGAEDPLACELYTEAGRQKHRNHAHDPIDTRVDYKCAFARLKNNQVPSINKAAVSKGKLHISLMFFPAKKPKVMTYTGSIAKNNKSVTAIPASLGIKVTAAHGNKTITATEPVNQPINFFFILFSL